MQTFLGIVGTVCFVAFIVFAFRQGSKVKPRQGDNSTSDAVSSTVDRDLHHP